MGILGTDENQHEVVIVPPEEWELLQSVLKQDRFIKEERDNALIELAKSNAQLNALQNMRDPSEWGPYAKRFGQQLCLNMAIERDTKELTRQLADLKKAVDPIIKWWDIEQHAGYEKDADVLWTTGSLAFVSKKQLDELAQLCEEKQDG